MQERIVIIGAGQAGAQAVASLRADGFAGSLTMIGDEPFLPYQRPPLSKAYLSGTATEESLYILPPAGMEKARIEFIGGVRAERIDRAARQLHLSDGRVLDYDKLVLATGGRARMLSLPGADRPNVFPLRSIADVQALHTHCLSGKSAVIFRNFSEIPHTPATPLARLPRTGFRSSSRCILHGDRALLSRSGNNALPAGSSPSGIQEK